MLLLIKGCIVIVIVDLIDNGCLFIMMWCLGNKFVSDLLLVVIFMICCFFELLIIWFNFWWDCWLINGLIWIIGIVDIL